jgi:hypothetical protein
MGKYYCTIDLLFDWFELVCFANKNKNCQYSKPVKQEVNGTMILPPLVFPDYIMQVKLYWILLHLYNLRNQDILDTSTITSRGVIQR